MLRMIIEALARIKETSNKEAKRKRRQIQMGLNIGYLTSDRTETGDEVYTPFYAVEPLLKYIPKDKVIWCPFDEEWSAFYQLFTENGYKVIRSSIVEGQDFFE